MQLRVLWTAKHVIAEGPRKVAGHNEREADEESGGRVGGAGEGVSRDSRQQVPGAIAVVVPSGGGQQRQLEIPARPRGVDHQGKSSDKKRHVASQQRQPYRQCAAIDGKLPVFVPLGKLGTSIAALEGRAGVEWGALAALAA